MNPQMLNMLQQQLAAQPDGQANPQMSALMQALLEKQQQKTESTTSSQESSIQIRRLRQSRNNWKHYAQSLSETVRFFAELFGACPACWGHDNQCPNCRGQGAIGSQNPDLDTLVELVSPLLAEAGLSITPTSDRGVATPQPTPSDKA